MAGPEAMSSENQGTNPDYEKWKILERQGDSHFNAEEYIANKLEQPKMNDVIQVLVKNFINIDPKNFSKGDGLYSL